jgi:hypothetical protein
MATPLADPESWGHVGFLAASEQKALEELRAKVTEEDMTEFYGDDKCLLRFLRARKFHVSKALVMLVEDDKWRSQFRGREFRLTDFSSLLALADEGVVRQGGRDKAGRPVIYVMAAKFFPAQITSEEELVLFYSVSGRAFRFVSFRFGFGFGFAKRCMRARARARARAADCRLVR